MSALALADPMRLNPYSPLLDVESQPAEDYFYLAGPMTGIPQFNFPAFDMAATWLRAQGYVIVSPAELDSAEARRAALRSINGLDQKVGGADWRTYLRRDVEIVLHERCVGVICLEGWERSKGARLETYVAEAFGKPIYLYCTDEQGVLLENINRTERLVAAGLKETA